MEKQEQINALAVKPETIELRYENFLNLVVILWNLICSISVSTKSRQMELKL